MRVQHLRKSTALLTSMLATVECLPSFIGQRDTPGHELISGSKDYCQNSTFINQSSKSSPKVEDCQRLAANIALPGKWTVGTDQQHQIAEYKTCAFGAKGGSSWYVYIGNQDIIDLITDSITLFAWNGLVGSKGRMICKGGITGGVSTEWGIYYNPDKKSGGGSPGE